MVTKTQWQVTLIDTTTATRGHRWVVRMDERPWMPLVDSDGHDLDRAQRHANALFDRVGLVRTGEWQLRPDGVSEATVVKRNRMMSP